MGSIFQRTSHGVEQTRALAAIVATELQAGDVVCLEGELGSGKTTFVVGLLEALGGDPKAVSSPTFTIENRYPLPAKSRGRGHRMGASPAQPAHSLLGGGIQLGGR
jgi:tRNA A37 threonylcarbamoyladenosine biosynthesis protein TsaE